LVQTVAADVEVCEDDKAKTLLIRIDSIRNKVINAFYFSIVLTQIEQK
jgi:hypothetical protein